MKTRKVVLGLCAIAAAIALLAPINLVKEREVLADLIEILAEYSPPDRGSPDRTDGSGTRT